MFSLSNINPPRFYTYNGIFGYIYLKQVENPTYEDIIAPLNEIESPNGEIRHYFTSEEEKATVKKLPYYESDSIKPLCYVVKQDSNSHLAPLYRASRSYGEEGGDLRSHFYSR